MKEKTQRNQQTIEYCSWEESYKSSPLIDLLQKRIWRLEKCKWKKLTYVKDIKITGAIV
jgi:hypothetical protein